MPNTNCLADIKCPKCGNEESFRIEAVIVCHVTDDGSEPAGDHHWDKDSFCHCPECEFDGKLSDFFIPEDERPAVETSKAATGQEGLEKQAILPLAPYRFEQGQTADTYRIFAAGEQKPMAEVIYIGGDEKYAATAETLARLFTAGPKMLAALQRAEFLQRRVSEGDHRASEKLEDAANQCLAAIEEATGRTV